MITTKVLYDSSSDKFIPKQCSKCNEVKPRNCFYNNASFNDGKSYNCKKCSNVTSLNWQNTKGLRKRQLKRSSLQSYSKEEKVCTAKMNLKNTGIEYKLTCFGEDIFLVENKSTGWSREMTKKRAVAYCVENGIQFKPDYSCV